jgi:REP element-mobilizing transposase RayT
MPSRNHLHQPIPEVENKWVETVSIPNLCQECHQHHHNTVVKSCRFCRDVRFPEQILCNLLLCLAPDHIHLYIDASPDDALDEIVNAVMAYSEQQIASQFPALQLNSQWSWERAYFIEGIG